MKTILTILFFIYLLGTFPLKAQKLEKIWTTPKGLQTPESVLYDENSNVIYVSNINGDPAQKDGNGFISILSPDGKIKDLEWVKKLNAPKGMAIYEGKLYVADIDQLVEIDIEKGKIVKKYDAPGAVFLNDVAACTNGMIFVSDTRTAKIYALHQGEFKVWLEGKPLEAPNGLLAEKGKLYIGDNNIYVANILTKKLELVIQDTGGVDGLQMDNDGNFVFSNWPGRIFLHKNGKNIKLLDTSAQKINSADIDFVHSLDEILVPTFFKNQVVAYKASW